MAFADCPRLREITQDLSPPVNRIHYGASRAGGEGDTEMTPRRLQVHDSGDEAR